MYSDLTPIYWVQKLQVNILVRTKTPKWWLPNTFPNLRIYSNAFVVGRTGKVHSAPHPDLQILAGL